MAHVALALAALASGAAALLYELLWVRRLGEITGSTTVAVYVVLTIFFAGLGVGARFGGRIADRHGGRLAVFVWMEAIVALSAIAFLPAMAALERAYTSLAPAEWPLWLGLATRAGVATIALAVPTLAMGGTIPALVRHALARRDAHARTLGWLYGMNTLGAALGVALTTFWLFPRVSVPVVAGAGVVLNLVAITLALVGRSRTHGAAAAPSRREGPAGVARPARQRATLLVLAALMGFGSVGFEVLWTRALSQRFLSTVYSFATILLVYLACLGLGALLTPLLDRARLVTRRSLAVVVLLAGLAGLLSFVLLPRVPGDLSYGAAGAGSFAERQLFELTSSVLVMLLPLLGFGLAFPMVSALTAREHATTGRDVGAVYLANTLGAVLAPFGIGLLLLPLAGLEHALVTLSWLLVLIGAGAVLIWRGGAPATRTVPALLAIGAAIALTILAPSDIRLYRHGEEDELVEYVEGVSSSIAVVREPDGNLFLKIDNSYRLGDARTWFAQQRQGLLPLLLHPTPETSLFIGLGTGSSAGAAAALGDVAVDVLEIVPELTDLLHHFASINENLAATAAARDDVRLLSVDARHFVRTTRTRYDVVVGDLFVPWRAGEGAMYTREHFTAVRDVLAEGGLFCQWLPLYQLRPDEVRAIVATMLEVFPSVEAYWLYFNTVQPCIGLVASSEPPAIDARGLRARISAPRTRSLLSRAGYSGARDVLGSFVADRPALAAYAEGAAIETRSRPLIEFLAPMLELDRRAAHAEANTRAMLALAEETTIPATGSLADAVIRYRSGVSHYVAGQLDARTPGRLGTSIAHFAAAHLETPDVDFVRSGLLDVVTSAVEAGRHEVAEPGIQALIRVRDTAHLGHYLDARVALLEDDPARARRALQAALRADAEHDASWELMREIQERWPETAEPEPYHPEDDEEAPSR